MKWNFHYSMLACCAALLLVWSSAQAAEEPTLVARWNFGTEETSPLEAKGGVERDQPGPRPPEFPDFAPQNTAVKFAGDGAHFVFADPGDDSAFDFTNGETITLEAWVNVEAINHGDNRYVVGKGRTGNSAFPRDNQNWALRVREVEGSICVSFLFATDAKGASAAKPDGQWHRWTTREGFRPGSGWHHIAVTYGFGEPESIRGWLDGKQRTGAWDMGGPTKEQPTVDNDAIWIASSQGGAASNSFRGWLDEIAIHRVALADDVLKSRYRRAGPEPAEVAAPEKMPELAALPAGHVVAQIHEGLRTHDRWPLAGETLAAPISLWETDEFLLARLPFRYDDWGIRDTWKPAVLLRLAADVDLPAGNHTFLIRTRGLSRLWIDGKLVVRTKPRGGATDGHEPVDPPAEPPLPGLRAVGYGDQEATGKMEFATGGPHRVVYEALVGGKAFRAEPGETLVAVRLANSNTYRVLTPASSASPPPELTDADISTALARAETSLVQLDDRTRRAAANSQAPFWQQRHELAKTWAKEHVAPSVPAAKSVASGNAIDLFIADKIERARVASSGAARADAVHFHEQVLPILRDHCFRCHGEKVKGGLRLNTRESALKGGESGELALVPHKPEASEIIRRVKATAENERMPPGGEGLKAAEIAQLEDWIKTGAEWPAPPVTEAEVAFAPAVDDAGFLRRVYLDTVGVPPRETEVRAFLADTSADKRPRVIDQLLQDERWADHWVSYWQDVLAENPNILKPSLNNSGPFRYFLYESLRDNKPLDQFVTDLVMLRGSEREGGSAGFGLATDNDAPLAAKGQVLAAAFLGVEMQCARCHDSPYHSTKQKDLYSLSALLARKTVSVPATSTVPAGFFEKNKARESLIHVTLKPGAPIPPRWPFDETIVSLPADRVHALVRKADDTREQLAAYLTAPENERFAQVLVNRIWKRLLGAGIVEPAHDWEGRVASHPELLKWLAHDLVAHDYDLKHLVRQILTSATYQRQSTGHNLAAAPEKRFFNAPERRRLTAEQVVDSLFAAVEQKIDVEEITFDPEGRRPANVMINLGAPRRAWMFASLSNERDRPSLSLPRAQMVTDVLEAFGWVGARQNPRTDRETEPTVLQPGVLANSVMMTWLTRASVNSRLADLGVEAQSPEQLVEAIYLRVLGRPPRNEERAPYVAALSAGFAERLVAQSDIRQPASPPRLGRVSWSNHLAPAATTVKMEMEQRARDGSPPDPRLQTAWRENWEDVVWSVMNSPEFVWLP